MFEQTKALCDTFLKMGIPGLDLMVYKDGECAFRYIKGYADPENKIPMTGKDKYHIYSASKLFTCVAAMQLWEKGLFSLDDELGKYIPAYKEMTVKTENGIEKAKNPIRIHHLFEMTSGMNYALSTPELLEYYKTSRCPTLELVQEFAKRPLNFEPGARWHYSLSHDVLAALVEVLSGQKFEDYTKEHIFDPLGMTNTNFLHPLDDWDGFARQYKYHADTGEFEPWWTNIYRPGPDYASGGAGCVSTVEDYMKFLEALRIGDVILKTETIDLMATNRLNEQQLSTYTQNVNGLGYGLGFRTPRIAPDRQEFGWGGAAGVHCYVDKERGVSVYYGQHVLLSPNMNLRKWLYFVIRADMEGRTYQIPGFDLPNDPQITY